MMKTKLIKGVLIGSAILAILALAAVLLLTSSVGENLARGWLEEKLTTETGLPVTIGRLETNLFSRVQIDSLAVGSKPHVGAPPPLFVRHLRISYSIPQLLGDSITLKALVVDGVVVALSFDSLGRSGIPLLDTPSADTADGDATASAITIDTLTLAGLSLEFFDAQVPLSVTLTGAGLSAGGVSGGRYFGKFTVDTVRARYDSLPLTLDNLDIAASIDSESVQIETARASLGDLDLETSGTIGLNSPRPLALSATLRGRTDALMAAIRTTYDLPDLTVGRTDLATTLGGTIESPIADISARVEDLNTTAASVSSVVLNARYADARFIVDSLSAAALGGVFTGAGSVSLDTTEVTSLDLSFSGIEMAELWRLAYGEASPYRGRISGRLRAEGAGYELPAWTVEAALDGRRLRYLEQQVPDLTCRLRLAEGAADITVTHGADEIQAKVALRGDTLTGDFAVSIPDMTALARFVDQPELAGQFRADGTISGTMANPAIRAKLDGSDIRYRNFPVDSLTAAVTYIDSVLTFSEGRARGSLDTIDQSRPPFDIDSLAGSVSYRCEFHGPLDNLTAGLQVGLTAPQYGSYTADSASVDAALNSAKLELNRCDIYRPELMVAVTAAYDTATASGAFDIRLRPGPATPGDGGDSVAGAPRRTEYGSIDGTFAVKPGTEISATAHGRALWLGLIEMLTEDTTISDGDLDFELTFDGSAQNPKATLAATARSILVSDFVVDSISANGGLTRRAVSVDSMVVFALGHTLAASGEVILATSADGSLGIADDAGISAEVHTEGFDLTVLQALLLPQGDIAGLLSTSINASGTISSPRVVGRLTAEQGRFLLAEGSAALDDVNLALSFADSTVTIENAVATVRDMPIEMTGEASLTSSQSIIANLQLQVGRLGRLAMGGSIARDTIRLEIASERLDMSVFQPFLTSVDSLSGDVQSRVTIEGSPSLPEINGVINVSSLALRAPKHYVTVTDGAAGIRFDRDRVILDSTRATLNGGTINVSGFAVHSEGELTDISLRAVADNVTFVDPQAYLVIIDSAGLAYGRQQDNYVLSGDVVLAESRLTAGLRPQSILPWVQAVETVEMDLPELVARSRLDIRIRESNQLWVDNNLAKLRICAELGVIGTPLRPNFTGLLKVEEGYLLYLDRRFKVTEGVVYFNDPARFNPDINLDANTQVTVYRRTAATPYTVYIRAEGLLDQLQYGLYSEPPLDKPDIVALLTLGATRTELAGNGDTDGGGLKGVLADRAARLTSQRVSSYVSRKAGSFFGFDEFTIQGNLFQFDDSWGPQLVASKRISPKINLTYSTTVGHLNDQAVRLGYHLTPKISLQGETDQQGRAGIDLKYGIRFK